MRAEAALCRSQDLLELTLGAIADSVVTTDRRGRIQSLNKSAESLCGGRALEVLGKRFDSIFDLELESGEGPFELRGAERRVDGWSEVRSLNDLNRLLEVRVSEIHGTVGSLIGYVIIMRDVTARQRVEEERAKAQRLESLGVLAGGIAHDFNNLLMGIQGTLALLERPRSEEERLELLAEADAACGRAQALTHQLTTFARGGEPDMETAQIGPLVEASSQFVLRGRNARLELSVADTRSVEVDLCQMDQVIGNIVLNAAQATPFGGCVRVDVEDVELDAESDVPLLEGPYVRVSVQDHGGGIPPENVSRIFEPYFTTKEEGTGLGLASCYSIVKKHGGCITVRSQVGSGSTFCVYLPAWATDSADSVAGDSTRIRESHRTAT